MNSFTVLLLEFFFIALICASYAKESLLAVSVATNETDGYKRYLRSLKKFNYDYKIFGLGEEWKGGNVIESTGGGQKINILIKVLEAYKNDEEKVILFTDSYDVIIVEEPETILEKFKSLNSRIVFGAETYCWPDISLIDEYPAVEANQKRFLNSGGFIGYANHLYDIITSSKVQDDDDDQLFYTKLFLNMPTREKYRMRLDLDSLIFQNLNGALDEVVLATAEDKQHVRLFNNLTKNYPSVVHGNGLSKLILNRIGSYIAKAYSVNEGCLACNEDKVQLDENQTKWPEVTVGLFIETPTPFLREFFEKISKLNYPKNKLSILIHNSIKFHHGVVEEFFKDPKNEYYSIKYISPEEDSPEHEARSEALQESIKNKCKHFFSIDSTAHLDNPDTLKLLIEQNRSILSPVLIRPDTTWSNVWGAVDAKGFYSRSEDYLAIISRKKTGVWNVPFISEVVLIRSDYLENPAMVYEDTLLDAQMAFPSKLRESNVFMFATNMDYFGHLINPENFNISKIRPEMFEIATNYLDWTERYIRPDYNDYVSGKSQPVQPCPDVFWFPVVTDEFCEDLITMMEDYGGWSGGKNNNKDERIPGGYENVPTVDIHMTQVGYQEHYLTILRKFIQPIQRKIFIGYYHDPPEAMLNFVVRYRPDEQDHLKPHHDASTYTMNIALNRPDVDFEGGGCRFVRYNCSVTKTKKGWAMIHPGRLTHYHEGLKVTNGTRYIMVSFIDP